MDAAEFASRVENLTQAITDEEGNLRPIAEITFEILAGQIRWSVWSTGNRRLQSLTTRVDDVDGLLEASKLLMQMAVEDQAKGSAAPKT